MLIVLALKVRLFHSIIGNAIPFFQADASNHIYLFNILGGLLICLPREQAAKYCAEIKKIEQKQAWIIGIVEAG